MSGKENETMRDQIECRRRARCRHDRSGHWYSCRILEGCAGILDRRVCDASGSQLAPVRWSYLSAE
jgi:hypothetical protein